MKINLLRQKILDLAIRGKLVPQDPNDEPASILLERIRAEKERLIAEGKIKCPKKAKTTSSESHYQKFTPPFAIPESWEWVDFENIFDNINSTPYQIKQSIIQPFGKYEVISQGQNEIDGYSDDDTKVFRFGNSCIVFGDHTLNVKFRNKEFVVGADGVKLLLPKIYPKYGYLLIQWRANNIKKRGYSRHFQFISNSKFPIPPYLEQQRIVRIFNNIISLVDDIEANKSLLFGKIRNAKSKILDLAMQGKLVPQDPADEPSADMLRRINPKAKIITDNPQYQQFTPPFDIPESWQWVRLDEICSIKGGKRIPRGKSFAKEKTSHAYLRVTDMKNNTIETSDLKYIDDEVFEQIKNYTINTTDLYLTIAGTIGSVGIIPPEVDGMNLTENAAKLTDISCDKVYLLYSLSSSFAQEHFSSRFHQVAQPKLSIETASSTFIPVPPLNEQKRIVAKIKELFSVLDTIEASLQS